MNSYFRTEFLDKGVVKCTLVIERAVEVSSGVTTEISTIFSTKDMVIGELPKTCQHCPVGFMCSGVEGGCGRHYPLDFNKRSEDCKLKTYRQFLDENHISY